jgi:uncharacterized protein with PIN domain
MSVPENQIEGTFLCPGCDRLYHFWWNGEHWMFELLKVDAPEPLK